MGRNNEAKQEGRKKEKDKGTKVIIKLTQKQASHSLCYNERGLRERARKRVEEEGRGWMILILVRLYLRAQSV